MAIVHSLAIGKSVKSAGNLTYKTVRGRTIASQRITTNNSKTALQVFQRGSFSESIKSMQLVLPWINNFFEKSKYGSPRNNFLKLCKSYSLGGERNLIISGSTPLLEGFMKGIGVSVDGTPLAKTSPYTSYGSAPVIVSGQRSVLEYASNDVIADVYEYKDGVTFGLTSSYDENKVEILIGGFNRNGKNSFVGIPFALYTYSASDEDIVTINSLGLSVTKKSQDGLVSSLTVSAAADAPEGVQSSVYVVTVRISGKIATTDAVISVSPAGPLP